MLYLKNKSLNPKTSFCFSTNTSISKKEKLLLKWVNDLELKESGLLEICSNKIKEILIKEINVRKNKKLKKKISDIKRNEIKSASKVIKSHLNIEDIKYFVKNITWEFNSISPENSIHIIIDEIYTLLENSKFENKPSSLLFKVLISEIYKNSQNENIKDRCLNNELLIKVLSHTDDELKQFGDSKFTRLLRIEIESLKYNVEQIKCKQKEQGVDIKLLKSQAKTTDKKVPKVLNLLPDYYSIKIFGWEDFLDQIKLTLKEKKAVSIYSEGGMGKSSFAKKYLKNFTEYDHIIWLNVENLIDNSFVSDSLLIKNLKLSFLLRTM